MYAIVDCQGDQVTVRPGDKVAVPFMQGEPGTKVTLERVLMIGGEKQLIGKPTVEGAKVKATIQAQGHDEKVTIFKFRRRTKYRRLTGHKQPRTVLQIDEIKV
jgi:large subunit ribosomal protein L21